MTEPRELHGLVYDAALRPELWPELLGRLAATFRSHFADAFSRTEDRSDYSGVAYGLDAADYHDQFLGTWSTRNVWGQRHPTRVAGEIVTTDQIISRDEMLRSEMYNEYLRARDLDLGLRLTTWSGEGWISDISLIRSWSAGDFDARERRRAAALLPHLERAAAISRQVATHASDQAHTVLLLDRLDQPALVVDGSGRLLRFNHLGEQLILQGDGLRVVRTLVQAATPADTGQLLAAIGLATAAGHRTAATVRLSRPENAAPLSVRVIPVTNRITWPLPDAGAALLLIDRRAPSDGHTVEQLRQTFSLTVAETEVALHLAAGLTVADIAAATGRSINTVRTHVAKLLQKTRSRRQGDLLLRLVHLGSPK